MNYSPSDVVSGQRSGRNENLNRATYTTVVSQFNVHPLTISVLIFASRKTNAV
jgi:hypothetical protein